MIEFRQTAYYHQRLEAVEVFFSIIALLQLVTLLRILRNFLAPSSERILQYPAIFLEKRIFRKLYVLSAWNDCYVIFSAALTLHDAFLSSSLRVVGYGRDIHKLILNFIYKNRKMISSSNFKWTSLVKVSIS